MTEQDENISEFLSHLPDKLKIIEEGIDIQTQKEYLDFSHSFDTGKLTEEETLKLGHTLFDTNLPLKAKKAVLVLLAHVETISAFKQIENYYNHPDKELKPWATLALHESKMFLESSLTEESTGIVSSGLGGLQDKLRYYFFVLPISDIPFTATQKNIIKEEYILVAKNLNCIVESVDQSDKYVGMIVLIPMDIAVGTFIDTGIKKCNELGVFVLEYYYVTNQDIPDASEINDIIKIVKE